MIELGFAGMGGLLHNSQKFPAKRDDIVALSASQDWIPVCARMTEINIVWQIILYQAN